MSTRNRSRRTVVFAVAIGLAALLLGFGTVTGMLFVTKAPQGQLPEREATRPDDADQLRDPLLRALDDVLDRADDLEDHELREARRILQEADSILTKAREDNRRAIEMANSPPVLSQPPQQCREETE